MENKYNRRICARQMYLETTLPVAAVSLSVAS